MNKITKSVLLIGFGVLLTSGVAFAAVQLSVSQQKVKTLRAVLTYQDVIGAPEIGGDPNTRILKIVDVPAEVEILSAYMKTSAGFQLDGETVRGSLDIYNSGATNLSYSGVVTGDLRGVGVIREAVSHNLLFAEDGELYLSVAGEGDLSGLTDGNLEVIVNYISQ